MVLKTVLTAMATFRIKVPTHCAGITGNGNLLTARYGLNLEKKKCPVPRSPSSSCRLSILLTPLLSRWTLLLS